MDTKIKNYLGIAAIIGILMAGYALFQYSGAYARSIQPGSYRSFAVSGEGKAVGVPDVAEFTFSVVTQGGKDIAALQKENTDKVNRAIAFVKQNGVDAKDIKTQNYNLEPRYQYSNCGVTPTREVVTCPPPEIVGYTITQSVTVKVRDFTKTGPILGGVIQNGANSVSQLYFKIDDPFMVQNQARAEAIQKAKARAQEIARAGGFRVGNLLSIDEGVSYPFYKGLEARDAVGAGGTAAPANPVIEPGSEEITVTVTLRYEIR